METLLVYYNLGGFVILQRETLVLNINMSHYSLLFGARCKILYN